MSYQEALEAAGANVIAFEYFGSYQGTWIAQIGPDEFVTGYFGSCSACDAFEEEFGWDDPDPEKLRSFGQSYLDTSYTADELIASLSSARYMYDDDREALEWLKARKQ